MAAATTVLSISNVTDSNFYYHHVTNSTDLELNYSHVTHYCEDYSDVDYLIRSIWMSAGYPILTFGTVGHLIVILLLLFNKRMRSLPLSVFLLTMSAAGLMALYMGLLPTILKYQTCHNERFEDQSTEFGCQLVMAAIYIFLQLYSWMEACVAVERMWAVRWALTYQSMSTRRNNAIVTGVIVIVLMAINGFHFKIFGTSLGYCDVEDEELFKIWQHVHSTVYILLPVAIMLPANAVTIHTMCKSPMKNTKEIKKAKPVAIMMLILNGIFVVTTTPLLVGNYKHLDQSEEQALRLAWVVSRLLMYLGCSLTFLVYVAVAARFRKAFSQLLLAGKNKVHAALVAMSMVGAPVRGNGEHSNAARGPETTIASHANSSTNTTTEGKV